MNNYTFDDLKPLQIKILELMKKIDFICQENDINYYLMGGTALGSIRHKGFIPWDDDLDIFMTPNDFDKFRKIIEKNNDPNLYLQITGKHKNYYSVPKVRMNGTTYIEDVVEKWDLHHGIYVDIFILHSLSNNFIYKKIQYLMSKLLILKSLSLKRYKTNKTTKIILLIMRLIPTYLIKSICYPIIFSSRNKKTKYKCNFLGKARYKNGIYLSKWYEKSKYVEFEDTQLRVSTNVEDFLLERFGDYMKIPNIESIKKEQHSKYWNLNEEIGWKNKVFYSDEKRLL